METWLHWYMVGFFAVFGVAVLWKRECFASIAGFVRSGGIDEPYADRLRAAIARREQLEGVPGAAIATIAAATSLAAALLSAFTPASTVLLYALLCVVLAGTVAVTYARLRGASGRRIASLRARNRDSIVPPWLAVTVAVAAVSPLAFVDDVPVAAVLVTAASIAIALVGDRMARLPALLSGDDPPLDEYVDDRLRAGRAVNLFATATAPAYVFDCFTAATVPHGATQLQIVAMLVAGLALLLSSTWQLMQMRRKPAAAELERWARLGV